LKVQGPKTTKETLVILILKTRPCHLIKYYLPNINNLIKTDLNIETIKSCPISKFSPTLQKKKDFRENLFQTDLKTKRQEIPSNQIKLTHWR
jgi:hypothetical protein